MSFHKAEQAQQRAPTGRHGGDREDDLDPVTGQRRTDDETGMTDSVADKAVHCDDCAACCCQMEVLLLTETGVPAYLTETDAWGATVMARLDDGWCAALERQTLRCSIYDRRPWVCRELEMGSGDCMDARRAFNLAPK